MRTFRLLIGILFVTMSLSANAQKLIEAGTDNLKNAIINAKDGDILELANGEHILTHTASINKSIVIRAAKSATPIVLTNRKTPGQHFSINEKCNVEISGITFDGEPAGGAPSMYAIVVKGPETKEGNLKIDNCTFKNFKQKGSTVISGFTSTILNELTISNSTFEDCFRAISFAVPKIVEGKPFYNLRKMVVYNTLFNRCFDYAIGYQSPTREYQEVSISVDHCVFSECATVRESAAVIGLLKVANAEISNSVFTQSNRAFRLNQSTHIVKNCCIDGEYIVQDEAVEQDVLTQNPRFKSGSFKPGKKSPLIGKATDKTDIGLK